MHHEVTLAPSTEHRKSSDVNAVMSDCDVVVKSNRRRQRRNMHQGSTGVCVNHPTVTVYYSPYGWMDGDSESGKGKGDMPDNRMYTACGCGVLGTRYSILGT